MPSLPLRLLLVVAAACSAQPAASGPLPEWSNYGPAERTFDAGFVMFVEHRDGAWHAWVPSYWGTWKDTPTDAAAEPGPGAGMQQGMVLDFFSGHVVHAFLEQDEQGEARPAFTTPDGVTHAPHQPDGLPPMRSTALVREWQFRDLGFVSDWRFDASAYEGCETTLTVVDKLDAQGGADWSRLVLDYRPPDAQCPHGVWSSQARAALDLHDGTFLLAMDRKIVRLSLADLSPVGTGATVRILDADVVHEIMSAGGDIHDALNRALPNH